MKADRCTRKGRGAPPSHCADEPAAADTRHGAQLAPAVPRALLRPEHLLALQQVAGNRAVQRLPAYTALQRRAKRPQIPAGTDKEVTACHRERFGSVPAPFPSS